MRDSTIHTIERLAKVARRERDEAKYCERVNATLRAEIAQLGAEISRLRTARPAPPVVDSRRGRLLALAASLQSIADQQRAQIDSTSEMQAFAPLLTAIALHVANVRSVLDSVEGGE